MVRLYFAMALQAAMASPAAPPLPPPPPAPVVETPPMQAQLVDFVPGAAQCGGRTVTARTMVRPFTVGARFAVGARPGPVELRFTVDADGRPLGIAPAPRQAGQSYPLAYVDSGDLAAVFSLWRFGTGGARVGCTITFTPQLQPVADAPIEDVHRVAALQSPGAAPVRRDLAARITATDCVAPRPPRALLRGYPDHDRVEQGPGTPSHAIVGFDIDAGGTPFGIGISSSSGNTALDREAIVAVGKSRFAAGDPRRRCTVPFVHPAIVPVPAPPAPDIDQVRPAGSTCPDRVEWRRPPEPTFPEPFRRRAIEGWAIIAHDLAPWGATGDVRVLASEPAAAFGEEARRIVATAAAKPLPSGARGCVTPVLFKMMDAPQRHP